MFPTIFFIHSFCIGFRKLIPMENTLDRSKNKFFITDFGKHHSVAMSTATKK